MMCPKPIKPVRGTKAAREHMGKVAALPCCLPGCGKSPVEVHHLIHGRFSQSRSSDFETIPLCMFHHWELHNTPNRWRQDYGLDRDYLAAVTAQIYGPIGTIS